MAEEKKGTTTSQNVEFSPEARRIISQELPLFARQLLPQQDKMTREGSQAVAHGPTSPFASAIANLQQTGKAATGKAGELAGLGPDITGGIQQGLGDMGGDQEAILRQLSAAIGEHMQSLTDPRFAQFLKPDVTSSTAPTGAQQAQEIAQAVLQIAAAAAGAG